MPPDQIDCAVTSIQESVPPSWLRTVYSLVVGVLGLGLQTVPLLLDTELDGALDVQSNQADAFGPDDQFILEMLGIQIATAIQEDRLYEAGRQQAWLSTALLQVADAMGKLADMDAVLNTIVRMTLMLARVDRCVLLMWDADASTFVPSQTYGLDPEARAAFEHLLSAREQCLPRIWLGREALSAGQHYWQRRTHTAVAG